MMRLPLRNRGQDRTRRRGVWVGRSEKERKRMYRGVELCLSNSHGHSGCLLGNSSGVPDNTPVSLSPLFWLKVDNRRRPKGSLKKTLHSINFHTKRENTKNCPFPRSRRLSRAKSRHTPMCASVWQSVGVALSVLLPRRRRRSSLLWGSSLGRRPLRPSWGCGTHHKLFEVVYVSNL